MENRELAVLLARTGKHFEAKGPGAPKGPGPEGPKGPPPEKKVLMLLNAMLPDQPVPFVAINAGISSPEATREILAPLAEQGLIAIKEEQEGERTKRKISITDAGRAQVEEDKAAFKARMEAGKKAFIEKCDAKLDVLTDEEKETLAALLKKIPGDETSLSGK